jgi:NitT/TauT family transport system ATP-binding protein
MKMIDIELDHITHYFEKDKKPFKVLSEISAKIYKNDFVSIIGPSGCGKSTLLFIIAGFIIPSEGYVRHRGEIVKGPSKNRGIVFQADAVFPWLTVYGNIEFGLKSLKLPKEKRDEIVKHYIKLVQLEGFENLYPKQLSGGMRKRVDVARTFAINPDILLLDESFGSLDAQTKETLQVELLNLWEKEKKTAIFVTHDIEEAIFLADRVYVMSSNPGTINEIIDVPFGRPRNLELKLEQEFTKLRHHLMDLLGNTRRA